jgi:serine protease Do
LGDFPGFYGLGVDDPQSLTRQGHTSKTLSSSQSIPLGLRLQQLQLTVMRVRHLEVGDGRHLQLAVAETKPGATVPVGILRDGNKKTVDVTVKELRGAEQLAASSHGRKNDTGTLNGVAVGDLNQQTRGKLNVPKDVQGAVVTEVDPNSAAAEAGLKPGDVIQEINRHPVKNANDAVRLTEKTDNKQTLVRVWEDGGSRYVVVDESEKAG